MVDLINRKSIRWVIGVFALVLILYLFPFVPHRLSGGTQSRGNASSL